MNKLKPSRGEIWFANLNPTVGHEQSKSRPCLIISVNQFNYGPAELVVILPMTTKNKNLPWYVEINPPEGGIKLKSFIICDQVRTISKKRLIDKSLGIIHQKTLYQIEKRLEILLGLN